LDKEKIKNRIIELIDKNTRNGPKIAFYSDPKVANLIDELYSRWEKNNRVGIPLDYANDEEMKFLYNIALKYSNISDAEAWTLYLSREGSDINPTLEELAEAEEESRKTSILRRIFWFLIPGER